MFLSLHVSFIENRSGAITPLIPSFRCSLCAVLVSVTLINMNDVKPTMIKQFNNKPYINPVVLAAGYISRGVTYYSIQLDITN